MRASPMRKGMRRRQHGALWVNARRMLVAFYSFAILVTSGLHGCIAPGLAPIRRPLIRAACNRDALLATTAMRWPAELPPDGNFIRTGLLARGANEPLRVLRLKQPANYIPDTMSQRRPSFSSSIRLSFCFRSQRSPISVAI
jgi:hypothetical protein